MAKTGNDKTEKKLTLRQRMRQDAEPKLDALVREARMAVTEVVKDTRIAPSLLMQLAASPAEHKTLRHKLVTMLANDAETELEALYSRQLAIDLGDADANARL